MAKVFTAPETTDIYDVRFDTKKLFLGGGITGCPDWQSEVIKRLDLPYISLSLYNPRRTDWNREADDSEVINQIKWEHTYLRKANAIMFWFPEESICPITLFELGYWLNRDKKLFIGTHPKYPRALDVLTQVGLADNNIPVRDNLDAMIKDILIWS